MSGPGQTRLDLAYNSYTWQFSSRGNSRPLLFPHLARVYFLGQLHVHPIPAHFLPHSHQALLTPLVEELAVGLFGALQAGLKLGILNVYNTW